MAQSNMVLGRVSRRWGHMLSVVQLAPGRLRARTPSGGSGPLRRACAPFAAKAAQGCRRQTPAAARGYALFGRSGLRPSLVRGDTPRNAPLYTMPRWPRGAGVVSMPPIAHPRRAAKPPAATTAGSGPAPTQRPQSTHTPAGAGLVPALPPNQRTVAAIA